MAEVSGLDMVREIIGQINNLRRLVTINGKKYKWDGKKYVRAVDGKKFTKKELVSYVKDERFRAPGTDNPRKDPSRPKKQTFETKAKNKLKSIKTNLKGEVNKTVGQGKNIFNNLKMKVSKPNAFSYEDTNKANAPTRSNKLANMLKMNKAIGAQTPKGGAVRGAIGSIGTAVANPLVDQVVDRLFRNISGNQKMSIEDYRAMMQQRRDNWPNVLKSRALAREAEKPLQIRNRRGRVTETVAPPEGTVIGRRNEQYIDRTQSTPTPTTKKEEPKEQVKVNKKKKSTVGKVMGDYAGSYNETKSKKKDKKKEDKSKEQIDWEKKSKNSPARKSKAFTDKELWEQYKKHQEWLKKNNRLKVRS